MVTLYIIFWLGIWFVTLPLQIADWLLVKLLGIK
jgi:hypothetical protein